MEVTLELIIKLIAELEAGVKIQQLKELKVFNALRLSVKVLVELAASGLGCRLQIWPVVPVV